MSERFVDVVEQEIAEEKAGALGRSVRRLEHALDLFRNHDVPREAIARVGARRPR